MASVASVRTDDPDVQSVDAESGEPPKKRMGLQIPITQFTHPSKGIPAKATDPRFPPGDANEGATAEAIASEGATAEAIASEGATAEAIASEGATAEVIAAPPAQPPLREWPSVVRVLTWNIAECLPSIQAPHWTPAHAREKICAELVSQDADIVCLQEAPKEDFQFSSKYALVGAVHSHCGFVQLFVRTTFLDIFESVSFVGPAVCGKFAGGIAVASMHLHPFQGSGPIRLQQLANIRKHCGEKSILAGDANIRQAEAAEFLKTDRSIVDAHHTCSNGKPFTWNTGLNKYHHYKSEITCNFDRVFVTGKSLQARECVVIADTPASANPNHFLSDHFGLLATIAKV